jgi:hypothetical protein
VLISFSHLIPPNGLSAWKLNPASSGVRYAKQTIGSTAMRSPNSQLAPNALTGFGRIHERPDGRVCNQEGVNIMTSPAHKIRDGVLQVTIWRNTSTEGKTYYTVNPSRSYKAGDDTWKESDSLNADDLLAMAELLREAYVWIKNQKRADAKGRKEAAAA